MQHVDVFKEASKYLLAHEFFEEDHEDLKGIFFRYSFNLRIELVSQLPKSSSCSANKCFCLLNDNMNLNEVHRAIERTIKEFTAIERSLEDNFYEINWRNGELRPTLTVFTGD